MPKDRPGRSSRMEMLPAPPSAQEGAGSGPLLLAVHEGHDARLAEGWKACQAGAFGSPVHDYVTGAAGAFAVQDVCAGSPSSSRRYAAGSSLTFAPDGEGITVNTTDKGSDIVW